MISRQHVICRCSCLKKYKIYIWNAFFAHIQLLSSIYTQSNNCLHLWKRVLNKKITNKEKRPFCRTKRHRTYDIYNGTRAQKPQRPGEVYSISRLRCAAPLLSPSGRKIKSYCNSWTRRFFLITPLNQFLSRWRNREASRVIVLYIEETRTKREEICMCVCVLSLDYLATEAWVCCHGDTYI